MHINGRVVGVGSLRGVRAQQVMTGEPAGRMFGEQVSPGQLGQERGRPIRGRPGQAGHRRVADVRPRLYAQQPEQPCAIGTQVVIGGREDDPQVSRGVTPVERVETPGGLMELRGGRSERKVGAGGGAGSDDGERQREAGALVDDLGDGIRLRGRAR
jgi:hypothetical protein